MIEGFQKPFGYVHESCIGDIDWPGFWKLDYRKRILTLTAERDFLKRTKLINETL